MRRGYYTDNREDALIMWRDAGDEPDLEPRDRLILGIETSCDETAAAVVTGDGECSRRSSPPRPTCTRVTAASSRRSPRGGI